MRKKYNYWAKNKMMSLEEWSKELRYQKSNVVWVDKFGTKHALWSKAPTMSEDGELIMVDNVAKEIQYYDWIRENKPELLKI